MRVIIAGDFCSRGRVANLIDNECYDDIFGEVKDIIHAADYSIVNFENPVVEHESKPIEKQGPNLRCSAKAVDAIKYAGFDCVTLANNHLYDYGDIGVADTLQVLSDKGFDYVGGGKNITEASQVLYKGIEEKKLAIINCCEHEFSIATDCIAGANPLNPIQQYYQIQEAKKNADYVLVIIHGGHEHFQLPSLRMQETYRFYIDSGADAIVNHHQHCFSGYEVYKGKPIFYGLGNFCFDNGGEAYSIWNEGYILELDFNPTEIKTNIYPYVQCYQNSSVSILSDSASFFERLQVLNKIIADNKRLKEEVRKYYDQQSPKINLWLEPYDNRWLYGLRRRNLIPSFVCREKLMWFLNFIDCESHRDKILHYLREQNKGRI